MSCGCAPGELLTSGGVGAVDAYRTINLLGNVRRGVLDGLLRCCWSLLGRVHAENESVAAEGASIAGGKRFANALAGHSALLVSIVDVCVSRERREVMSWEVIWQSRTFRWMFR